MLKGFLSIIGLTEILEDLGFSHIYGIVSVTGTTRSQAEAMLMSGILAAAPVLQLDSAIAIFGSFKLAVFCIVVCRRA